MQAAGFKCQECGKADEELHVHHCYYEKGLAPWEYDDECFKVLCQDHHSERQRIEPSVKKLVHRFSIHALLRLESVLTAIDNNELNILFEIMVMGDCKAIQNALQVSRIIGEARDESYKFGKHDGLEEARKRK